MLSDQQIETIIAAEERDAIGYSGDGSPIQKNRSLFLDYYNQLQFGNETEGMSSFVSSDVYDVIEGLIPPLMRMFSQGKNTATFHAKRVEIEKEAMKIAHAKNIIAQAKQQGIEIPKELKIPKTFEEKAEEQTVYCNHVFERNGGNSIKYQMIKDGLLSYTGWVKVTQSEEVVKKSESYRGLSDLEVSALEEKKDFEVVEKTQDEITGLFNVRGEYEESVKIQSVENVPPEETVHSKRSRDFKKPHFIGQYTAKTRSELIEMGFEPDVVKKLGQEDYSNIVRDSREHNTGSSQNLRSNNGDDSQDELNLGEYYMKIDVDQDGISELWQFFYCEGKLLKKTRVDRHPYAVFVPIPIPHRAIGTCPAEHVAPIQLWRSTLIRQMNNNIYATNFNRVITNDSVNLDDVLDVKHGGVIRVDGIQPVANSVQPFVVQNQVPAVLEAIQYADSQREQTSSVTSHNQGLDTESLNKTATGFQGLRDMSMMKTEVIARQAAEALKEVFEMIAENALKYQDERTQIKVFGELMDIDPTEWREVAGCDIEIGTGAGDRQERIQNLNFILMKQEEYLDRGWTLTDQAKVYRTLDKLCVESGLKDASPFFSNPEKPIDMLQAENFQMQQQIQQFQAQMENPLAEAERAKGEMEMMQQQQKNEHELDIKMAEMNQEDRYHEDDLALELTKLEMKSGENIKGSLI